MMKMLNFSNIQKFRFEDSKQLARIFLVIFISFYLPSCDAYLDDNRQINKEEFQKKMDNPYISYSPMQNQKVLELFTSLLDILHEKAPISDVLEPFSDDKTVVFISSFEEGKSLELSMSSMKKAKNFYAIDIYYIKDLPGISVSLRFEGKDTDLTSPISSIDVSFGESSIMLSYDTFIEKLKLKPVGKTGSRIIVQPKDEYEYGVYYDFVNIDVETFDRSGYNIRSSYLLPDEDINETPPVNYMNTHRIDYFQITKKIN